MADRQTDVAGVLVSRLGANGWSLTAGHQSLDWANLVLQIPAGELEIEHMSDWWLIRLLLRTGTQIGSLPYEMFVCGSAEPMVKVVAEELEHLERAREDP